MKDKRPYPQVNLNVVCVALMKNAFGFGMASVLTSGYRSGSPQTEGYYVSFTTPPPMSRLDLSHRKEPAGERLQAICLCAASNWEDGALRLSGDLALRNAGHRDRLTGCGPPVGIHLPGPAASQRETVRAQSTSTQPLAVIQSDPARRATISAPNQRASRSTRRFPLAVLPRIALSPSSRKPNPTRAPATSTARRYRPQSSGASSIPRKA